MNDLSFRPAKRENVGLLIGLGGPSGSGKTYSAMRLAAGIVGPGNRFAVIDTEGRRALHYADMFAFDHLDLLPPFTPAAYEKAIVAADAAGYRAIVVDSASHEWAGEGGILEWQEAEITRMAGDDYKKREAVKMAAWIKPKMAHKHMIQRLLQVRAHLILCFRAEEKLSMERDRDGKMQIVKKQGLTGKDGWFPICEKSLPFELTVSFLMLPDHPGYPIPLKLQEQHKKAFNTDHPLDEQAGAVVAAWAAGGVAPAAPSENAMSENQVVDWCLKMEEAPNIEELSRSFTNAMLACKEVKDGAAQKRITAAKDKRKAVLTKGQ